MVLLPRNGLSAAQVIQTITDMRNDPATRAPMPPIEVAYRRRRDGQVSVIEFGAKGDGVTNDTAAIQAAINAASAASLRTYLPTGVYLISANLTLPTNAVLFGDGPGSELQQIGTTVFSAIVNANPTLGNANLTIRDLRINGNRSVRLAGLPAEAGDDGSNGIRFSAPDAAPANGVLVQDVTIENTGHVGLMIFNATDVRITRVIVRNTRRDGIDVWFNSSRVVISDCIVYDCGDDCISICGENPGHTNGTKVTYVSIIGGTYSHRADSVFGRGIYLSGADDVTVSGAVISNTFSHGIQVDKSYVTNYAPKRITITGCTIMQAGNATTSGSGISVTSCDGLLINGNVIEGAYNSGILVNGVTAARCSVVNNVIRKGQATASIGINIAFGATDVSVKGNRIAQTPSYGIACAAHDCSITDNHLYGCCDIATGNSFIYVTSNASRLLIVGNKLTKLTGKGLYGVRFIAGSTLGCLTSGNMFTGFGAGNGYSDVSTGPNTEANNVTT